MLNRFSTTALATLFTGIALTAPTWAMDEEKPSLGVQVHPSMAKEEEVTYKLNHFRDIYSGTVKIKTKADGSLVFSSFELEKGSACYALLKDYFANSHILHDQALSDFILEALPYRRDRPLEKYAYQDCEYFFCRIPYTMQREEGIFDLETTVGLLKSGDTHEFLIAGRHQTGNPSFPLEQLSLRYHSATAHNDWASSIRFNLKNLK